MEKKITIQKTIPQSAMGSYFEIPFSVPEGVERIDVNYAYRRHALTPAEGPLKGNLKKEVNIIDLGLRGPGGFVGASGSDRTHVWVAARKSARGYADTEPVPGEWTILVGAYKIENDGVAVDYTITLTFKTLRLFKGDTHAHTIASDGALTVPQLAARAGQQGLQFLILTDHNNYAQNSEITGGEDITLVPGCELTHYKGHCNLYGVRRPLQNPLGINSPEEMELVLREAKANGALISINHPFCRFCGWHWGFKHELYDMLEIWNGGLHPEDNRACRQWWEERLNAGEKIPIVGGSDFHRSDLLREVGQPTTGVWALSASPADLLAAMAAGHSYVAFTPGGPGVFLRAGNAFIGDTATGAKTVQIELTNLRAGDSVHFITPLGREVIPCENTMEQCLLEKEVDGAAYCRVEIYREPYSQFLGPVLISNPLYFEP